MSKSSPTPATPAEALSSFPRRHAATRRFTLGAPRSFAVSEDGSTVLFLRSGGPSDPTTSLWKATPAGEPELAFDASVAEAGALTDAERARRERAREQASGVVAFSCTRDGQRAVFALGGELACTDVGSGTTTMLATDGNAFDPRFEPKGNRIAYVSGSGLRITDGTTDRAVPGLDVSDTVSWGSAEFVAAEEMGRGRGYWWDPSGHRMAVCRVDTAGVDQWWISSPAAPASEPRPIRYPAAGTANADVSLWIVDADGGPEREIDWRRGEFEYLAAVHWGDTLLVTVQTRDQRTLVVLAVDPNTGDVEERLRTTDATWVELQPNTPKPTELGLVTIVDDASTDRRTLAIDGVPIDLGAVNVRSLVGVTGTDLVVTVTTDGTDSVLARVTADGHLDHLSEPGQFTSGVLGGETIVAITAAADRATQATIHWHDGTSTDIVSLADEPGFACTPEFHFVGERSLAATLSLPQGHDGSPLPVLLDPYGGPHAQRVLRVRNGYATSQWFAEQGFAVVVVDGRGTPGRGPAFEREIYGDFATKVLDDQIDALHALAETHSELDLDRVGIRGWSFGGYLAALAVLRRPDAVHAAVAGAPVTEWRLYDTHYTERYLGHPEVDPGHYERSSLLRLAPQLSRPLMLIHGLADDNVVAAHTLQLSQALLVAGRPHEVLPLSGVTHMTPQEQVAENLLHLQRDFLHRHLSR